MLYASLNKCPLPEENKNIVEFEEGAMHLMDQ